VQTGQQLDGRDDGRGIPGRAESRLGCMRLRYELRCRVGLVLRLVLRGGCRGGKAHRAVSAALLLLLLHATDITHTRTPPGFAVHAHLTVCGPTVLTSEVRPAVCAPNLHAMRDLETIDGELRLLAAVRAAQSASTVSSRQVVTSTNCSMSA
jgi:hypothetical protein